MVEGKYGNVGRESRDEERQDEKYIIRELISAMARSWSAVLSVTQPSCKLCV